MCLLRNNIPQKRLKKTLFSGKLQKPVFTEMVLPDNFTDYPFLPCFLMNGFVNIAGLMRYCKNRNMKRDCRDD